MIDIDSIIIDKNLSECMLTFVPFAICSLHVLDLMAQSI